MKTATPLLLLAALSLFSGTGAGQALPDTSKWPCSLCKFEDGLSGTVEAGAASVSDASAKYGEYNGLGEDGTTFIGELSARSRGKDAAYWNLDAANLGRDTRSLDAEGGRQGRYKLQLHYQGLPHLVSDSARTPFIGSGGASLSLPAGFPANTTALMPLAGTLRPVDLESTRKELGAGASWTPAGAWQYGVHVRRETREGRLGTSGAFFVNAAQLVRPVDYVTDQLDAYAAYTGARLQAKLAYYGSTFGNDVASLTWQNPFVASGFPGAVAGELALPPDNQFHQVSATLGYRMAERTRATADLAFGRGTQDQQFVAPTLNGSLAAPALPRASLEGRVDTVNASLEVNSELTDRLRLNAAYRYNDRNNRTPQSTYAWVTTDMFVAPSLRVNLPYSFTQDRVQLRADYKAAPRLTTSAGYDFDSLERTFQEVDTTRENTVWARLAGRPMEAVDLTLKFAYGDRGHSGYQAPAQVTPPENPLLRKYNMADRTRSRGELRANIAAAETVSLGLQIDVSEDDYSQSTIGLTHGQETNLGGDLSWMLSDRTSLHFFANRQEIKSEQSGSQAYATPDWSGENDDTIDLLGVGAKHIALQDKLELGADFTLTRTRGAIRVDPTGNPSSFPDLTTSRKSLRLYAHYRLKDNVSLRGGYWYERYDSDNWALDGVAPDTIANVLAFGQLAPQYRVHVIALSARYRF